MDTPTPTSSMRRVSGFVALILLVGSGGVLAWINRAPAPAVPEVPAPAAAPGPGTQAAASGTEGPGFDLVRVEQDGAAVVAGTAVPGSRVTILADEQPLAEVRADDAGNFVAIFNAEPSAVPRTLSLDAVAPDGKATASDDVVMLLPAPGAVAPVAPAAAPVTGAEAQATEDAGSGTSEPSSAVSAAASPAPAPAPATVAEAPRPGEPYPRPIDPTSALGPPPRIGATVLLRGAKIEAIPADAAPDRQVALASISYGAAGAVTLEGLGSPGYRVRAYVDDGLAQEGVVDANGRWALPLDAVAQGIYRLRIDAVDTAGQVKSRVETPFQRDFPRLPPPRPGEPGDGVVTVQPGGNLWTIARLHLGSGVRYTQIFTANRDLIRDPDLIYPGQILNLPEAAPESVPAPAPPG